MSYAYRTRKKAIKKAKRKHADDLDFGHLKLKHMPSNPHPPKLLGVLADLMETPE